MTAEQALQALERLVLTFEKVSIGRLDVMNNLYSRTKLGGFAYRLNPRTERDPPQLIPREEAVKWLADQKMSHQGSTYRK